MDLSQFTNPETFEWRESQVLLRKDPAIQPKIYIVNLLGAYPQKIYSHLLVWLGFGEGKIIRLFRDCWTLTEPNEL